MHVGCLVQERILEEREGGPQRERKTETDRGRHKDRMAFAEAEAEEHRFMEGEV